MSILFTRARIGPLTLGNRFVRSATYDGYADRQGFVTPRQIELYSNLARGGIGLIITGIAYVQPSGRISIAQNAIDRDDCISGLKRLTDAVHGHGAGIAVQLFHAGRETGRFKPDLALGPSPVKDDPYFQGGYRAMTGEDILDTARAFGEAALRARAAGFDGVQIHGAHAYLVSQFLSPYTNRRQDEWGGDLKGRLGLHREIYREIRARVGPDYPVMIKLGVEDGFPGGLVLEEGLQAARLLAETGYDALEISSGLRGEKYEGTEFRTRVNSPDREAYFRSWAAAVKKSVSVPVMMVGGLRRLELLEEIIERGDADFVSLCRPFICQPDLVRLWKNKVVSRSACISCNKCYETLLTGAGLVCVTAEQKAG